MYIYRYKYIYIFFCLTFLPDLEHLCINLSGYHACMSMHEQCLITTAQDRAPHANWETCQMAETEASTAHQRA